MRDVPDGWRVATWGHLATLEYGKALRDYRAGIGGTPVFGTNGRVGTTDRDPLFGRPGVIVGRKGAYRGIHYSDQPFYVIDTAFYLSPVVDLDLRWSYYELLTHDINGMDSGSAIPSTSRPSFYAMPVLVPPVGEQRAIADVLGALDDKIESNHRISKLIDELLPLLLPSGGGDGDPVQLPDVADLQKGVSYRSADLEPSSTAMVSLKCFGRTGDFQPSGLKEYVGSPKPSQIVEPGEVVVAQTDLTQGAEVVGRALRIPSTTGYERLVASLDLIIVRPKAGIEPEYLYGLLSQERFRQHCRSRTSGTTVLHLASDALPSYGFDLPRAPARAEYVATVQPLLEQRDQLAGESQTLAALRDTLLPELLSGRLRVPEAEDLVADAV